MGVICSFLNRLFEVGSSWLLATISLWQPVATGSHCFRFPFFTAEEAPGALWLVGLLKACTPEFFLVCTRSSCFRATWGMELSWAVGSCWHDCMAFIVAEGTRNSVCFDAGVRLRSFSAEATFTVSGCVVAV